MKNRIYFTISFLLLALLLMQSAEAQTPNQMLQGVYKMVMLAKDYSVDANIKVDLPFIKILPINAKIYFKQLDKFKVESKSIAIVPRQGFDQFTKMLKDTTTFTSIVTGKEQIGTTETIVLNIIPNADTSDLILGKLWLNKKENVILKSQLTTKSNGTILTEFTYGNQISYGLPDLMVFTVDIKKFKIPKSVSADVNNAKVTEEEKKKNDRKGKIFITLSNYIINKGINDDVFKK